MHTPFQPPAPRPWWIAAMLAATATLPGCGGPSTPRPARPSAEATLTSARESADQGDADGALTRYEEAIALNPKLAGASMGAADLYRAKGDYISAERRYARAAELEPRNFDAQYRRALMLQLLGRYAEAVGAYQRALPLKPDDALTMTEAGAAASVRS